jgi:hypothetical protein
VLSITSGMPASLAIAATASMSRMLIRGLPALGVDHFGARRQRLLEIPWILGIDECGVDAELAEGHVELRIGAAVQRARRHDLVAVIEQRQQRGHLRRLPRGGGERRAPAFERGDALLEHRHRGIGDARIDVAEGLQVEQAGRVVRRVEHVGRGLVDRHRARAGGRIGNLSGVQAQRAEAVLTVGHLGVSRNCEEGDSTARASERRDRKA